ncbi:HNH endonuclease [Mangrovicoccus algicola]|uniref:Putative HNH nuclease YajD n=1 Tax=Mangrovicoccus algicola TaxID=2771008 RepID=A0A8J6YX82_9RHOB|nr:HNH endonuclease [Mangrovicoccus algicola]MBE3637476.1 HNH endonuclease [Mangrovicoccus algicola]
MARLRELAPRLSVLAPRVRTLPLQKSAEAKARRREHDARRDAEHAWRGWYKTARWQKLRWRVLADALFRCAYCGRSTHDTSQLVADHKRPHRGDAALFWDRANLQCLCKRCHDSDKQRMERAQ